MSRVKRGTIKNKRKKKMLKLAKGYRNARSTKFKQAKQAVIRAGQHSFAHRRKKKRVMRKNWQVLISGGLSVYGISYSRFIDTLNKKDVAVNRKMMADMIQNAPEAWDRFVQETTGAKPMDQPNVSKTVVEVADEVKEEAPKKASPKKEAPKKEEAKDSKLDDLTKVEGIGPKIAETLTAAGVDTFAKLAKTDSDKIQEMIADVRGNHDSGTWPKQAAMAADGKWDELKKWQDEMDGGKA